MRVLFLWLLSCVLMNPVWGSPEPLPFRDYGYFVGDRMTRCWRLGVKNEVKVSHPRLPYSLNRWLVVLAVRYENDRLCIDYQVDYAPFTTETVEIPEWNLTLRSPGGEESSLTLPSWHLTLAPLRPIQTLKGEAFMQPGALPPHDLSGFRQRFWVGVGLVALGLVGLFWYGWLGKRQVAWPFCRAWMEMSRLEDDDAGRFRAYLLLHRAFDIYWGGRWWGRLRDFLQRYPDFLPLSEELEAFVASSREVFFEAETKALPWSLARLRRLVRRLALEEIRHGGLAG